MADLYRHFDKDGRLLYVGCSISAFARFGHHRISSHWVKAITTMTIARFDSLEDALNAENVAINAESPLYNKIKKGNIYGGRPRLEDVGKTLEAKKPWVFAKMSRATWFRRQAEARAQRGQKNE